MTLITHNQEVTDSIKRKFIELVFEKHPNAAFIFMVKRDVGMVYSDPDVYTKSYCLVFGPEEFELMEIDRPTSLLVNL